MFVNIAALKAPCPRVGSGFEGCDYTLDNMSALLHKKYAEGGIGAGFYWFFAEFLSNNGYGAYVDAFHKRAIEHYAYGVLGLASLCATDITCLSAPFTADIKSRIDKTDFAIIEANKGVMFDCSLSEAYAEKARFEEMKDGVSLFFGFFDDVTRMMCEDIAEEEQRFGKGEDTPNAPEFSEYITMKREHVRRLIDPARKSVDEQHARINAAIVYYGKRIEQFVTEAAERVASHALSPFYKTPYAQVAERFGKGRYKIGKFAERLKTLGAKRLETIERELCAAFSLNHDHAISAKPPETTVPLFNVDVKGAQLNVSAASVLSGGQQDQRGTAAVRCSAIDWWKQCGKWGQWVYTYDAGRQTLNKWELYVCAPLGTADNMRVRRLSHISAPKPIHIGVTEQFVCLDYGGDKKLYIYNDLRYAVGVKSTSLPEFGLRNLPFAWRREMKKWNSQ